MRVFRGRYHVDQDDLQGNVLCAYGNRYPHALYAFIRVENSDAGRAWLSGLADAVTTARPWKGRRPAHTLNVSISCHGLRALGLPEPLINTFPEDFRHGMAARAKKLRDLGPSAPRTWDPRMGWTDESHPLPQEHHLLLTLYARDEECMNEARATHLEPLQAGGALTIWYEQPAQLLGNYPEGAAGREHFGFADGFGQPTIRGNAGPWDRPGGGRLSKRGCWKPVAPGEFVLGYPGEDGTREPAPLDVLSRSGTFTVVRKLCQDVAAFTNYLRRQSKATQVSEEWIAARIVGRWRDGTPLTLSPGGPNGDLSSDYRSGGRVNDFSYAGDQEGLICPLGAHIRRANPRDALGEWWEGRLSMRHRIIRRGMPFGEGPEDPARPDGVDRGLMFVCHQASIRRQFEVVQGAWLNDGDAFWLGDEGDLLTSDGRPRGDGALDSGMTIQDRPPKYLDRPPPLVILRGGGYFFTPGINGLRTIAAGSWL